MIFRISISALILLLFSCDSSNSHSNDISYHFFRENGKIGIVDSNGNITCEPKFDGEIYYPVEFNNIYRSKFSSIFDNKTNKVHIIDIHGNEPLQDLKKLRQVNHGHLAIYYEDYKANKGIHVISLKDKAEIGYYENCRGINFHGASRYFYSIIEDRKWKLFNESGKKVYENGYILEVDVIDDGGEFNAVVLSSGKKVHVCLDAKGNEIPTSNEIENKFIRLQEQNEIDYNKDHHNEYKIISSEAYSKNVNGSEVVKGAKYSGGEEVYIVTKDNLMGVVDSNGKTVIDLKYDKVEISSDMILVHKKDKIGLADLEGNLIFQTIFKSIRYNPYSARYLDLVYDNYWFEADIKGRIFTPKGIKVD